MWHSWCYKRYKNFQKHGKGYQLMNFHSSLKGDDVESQNQSLLSLHSSLPLSLPLSLSPSIPPFLPPSLPPFFHSSSLPPFLSLSLSLHPFLPHPIPPSLHSFPLSSFLILQRWVANNRADCPHCRSGVECIVLEVHCLVVHSTVACIAHCPPQIPPVSS